MVSEILFLQNLAQVLSDLTSFWPMGKPIWANGQITMTLHNYRSRQVHDTLNGVNPSCSYRDMPSAKSGPNLWQIWQVFGPWPSPYGANGQMTMKVHNYRPRQFHRTSNGENPSSGYRDMGSASLAAARPNHDNTPPAWRAEGVKISWSGYCPTLNTHTKFNLTQQKNTHAHERPLKWNTYRCIA